MENGYRKIRAIISGGGTGGHIFPAIAIADRLMELNADNEILFVGAEGRMEMEKVPAAGYRIVGLPIAGLQRKPTLRNLLHDLQLPFLVLRSSRMAGRVIDDFRPDVAIGVGGYASAPMLRKTTARGIPSLIQEQNSFAGLTNRMLGSKVQCICVAYEGMERFFPADRIVFSGNPIRKVFHPYSAEEKAESLAFYGVDPAKKHILIVGGSLGSGTLNSAVQRWITEGCPGAGGVEILWQCGSHYKAGVDAFMEGRDLPHIRHYDFIARMDAAYALADVVVSRSGASSISEICAVQRAAVFVPSPNVAEDHQTHNALALADRGAALMVRDADAAEELMRTALALVHDHERISLMESNAARLARPDAAQTIADEIYKLV